MSQQSQQPTGSIGQGTQGGRSVGTPQGIDGQQMGGQIGTSHQQTHQQVGQQFEAELTPELNQALEAFDRVVEISSWCADKCIESGPQMAECARLCNDLAEVAELNEKFIARDSINGPELAETFLRVAQQGMPILQQYQQTPHVQETLQAVDLAIESTNQLLSSIGGQQGFQEMAQQFQGQQPQEVSQGQMGQQPQGVSQGQMGQQPQGVSQGQMGQQPQGMSHGQVGQQSKGQQPQSQQFPQSY